MKKRSAMSINYKTQKWVSMVNFFFEKSKQAQLPVQKIYFIVLGVQNKDICFFNIKLKIKLIYIKMS